MPSDQTDANNVKSKIMQVYNKERYLGIFEQFQNFKNCETFLFLQKKRNTTCLIHRLFSSKHTNWIMFIMG